MYFNNFSKKYSTYNLIIRIIISSIGNSNLIIMKNLLGELYNDLEKNVYYTYYKNIDEFVCA